MADCFEMAFCFETAFCFEMAVCVEEWLLDGEEIPALTELCNLFLSEKQLYTKSEVSGVIFSLQALRSLHGSGCHYDFPACRLPDVALRARCATSEAGSGVSEPQTTHAQKSRKEGSRLAGAGRGRISRRASLEQIAKSPGKQYST